MMTSKIRKFDKGVSIKVHPLFFDKFFEPERRSLQNKIGLNLTQTEFTKYLMKSNAKISYNKVDNKFGPSRRRTRL